MFLGKVFLETAVREHLDTTCRVHFSVCAGTVCTGMGLVRSVDLFQTSSNQRPRLRSTVMANRPWRTRSNARQQAKMANTHTVMAASGCADRYSFSSGSQFIQRVLTAG